MSSFGNSLSQRLPPLTSLTRTLVVLGVMAAALFISLQPKIIYLAIPLGLAGAVLLFARPQLGFLAFIVGTLAVPFSIGTGSESRLHPGMLIVVVLLGMWLLETVLTRRNPQSKLHNPINAPLVVFLIVVLLAFIGGQLAWFPRVSAAPIRAQLGGLGIFVISAITFWLAAYRIQKESWLRHITWLFLLVAIGYVFAQFVPSLSRITFNLFERNASGATGSIFWIWLAAFAVSQGLLNKKLGLFWRVMLLASLLPTFYYCVVINREWTSGWLPMVLAVGLVLWQAYPRWRMPMAAVGGGVLFFRAWQSLQTYVLTSENTYSLDTRVAAWTTLWELIKINPILGFGPSNYYYYTPLFPILGYRVNFNSHNNYVDLIAQTGFVGLIAFIWFAVRTLQYINAVSKRTDPNSGFARAYVVAAFAGWASTLASGMLGDWFLPFVYNLGFVGTRSSLLAWLFLGGVVALDRWIVKRPRPTQPLMLNAPAAAAAAPSRNVPPAAKPSRPAASRYTS